MIKRRLLAPIAAAVAATVLSFGSGNAVSAIVCDTTAVPITVPANIDGVYINFVTGATGTTGGAVAGYDWNPYKSSVGLTWLFSGANGGGVGAGTTYSVLASGVSVSGTSTFLTTNTSAAFANWRVAQTGGYLGVRLNNEGTAAVNYGWVQLDTAAGTTGSLGFPATINHYCFQNDGTAINTGDTGVVTFTVTPSVGTPAGTITPNTPQSVASGSTTDFTLAPDAGFHTDTVTGTCGGTLTGNSYVTSPVTANCTVIANFAADALPPTASVTPSPFTLSVAAGASASGPLTIANTGGGSLTWSLTEAAAARPLVAPTAAQLATQGARNGERSGGTSLANPAPQAVVINEGFDDITTLPGAGWLQVNNSSPAGLNAWFQGNPTNFNAFDGATTAYISANFNSGGDPAPTTISNWLVTPLITFNAGSTASFYTRSISGAFPDRMQVRLCTGATCTNVGTGATGTGDFGTVLLDINPTYSATGYPTVWTQQTLSGLPSTGTGRIAFRYFVENAGPSGANSNLIGIDRVVIDNGTGGGPTGCTNPSDVPWLSESSTSGTVAGGASENTTVTVDAAALTAGSYSAHICVATNDTANALVDVPVNVTVTTGGGGNHIVTPSVGTPSGTITPSTPVTVADGATTSFTLAADAGFHINNVTGTCNGTLAGAVFTTAAVIADCTVIANFAADGSGTFPPDENFDEVTAPALPTGFTSAITGDGEDWVTQTTSADTAPNAAFTPDHETSGDASLTSPSVPVSFNSSITFRHHFAFEQGFDGARLEISVDAGAFTEFTAAGGTFTTGGYNGTLTAFSGCSATPNPLADGPAWTGTVAGFTTVNAQLPASAAGHSVAFRWHSGSDCSVAPAAPNGWWVDTIHLNVGGSLNDPAATVAPTSLTFTAPVNGTATQTLHISDAANSAPLTYAIEARGVTGTPTLRPYTSSSRGFDSLLANPEHANKLVEVKGRFTSLHASDRQHGSSRVAPWTPVTPNGTPVTYQADDGAYENGISLNNGTTQFPAVWINRYAATGAVHLDSISIDWPNATTAAGDVTGKAINLVAYYDADADGDPSNAVRLGVDTPIVIGGPDVFENYPVDFQVPGAGDVYIGFSETYAIGGFAPPLFSAAIDQNADASIGYVSGKTTSEDADLDNLANNDLTGTISDLSGGTLPGAWMVRATGTSGGGVTHCTGPIVPWLTAVPASGTVNGGDTADVVVTADPAAGSLAAGTFTGELCITTNDPLRALITVPVTLTVTDPVVQPCSGGADEIFCDGFELADTGTCDPAQLLLDPSFEASLAGGPWDSTSTNFGTALCDDASCGNGGGTATARTGTVWAWFGGIAAAETATASQAVVIPTGTRFLNFYLWIGSATGGAGATNMDVNVDGTSVVSYPEPAVAEAGYTLRSIDMSAFADGASHTIEFNYVSPGTSSNYSVDDVTLDCAAGSPVATRPAPNAPKGPASFRLAR